MRSGSHVALHIAVCALLLAGPGLAAGTAVSESLDPGETTLRIDLHSDGNASVTVTQTYALTDRNETRAFRDLAASFERGDAGVGPSVGPFRRASEAASEAAERPMAVGNVSRNATLQSTAGANATGRLSVSFRWTNFSQIENGRLTVDDAFRTSDGTWLPGLEADQRLVIALPDDHALRSARGQWTIEDGALIWSGPATFDEGDLEIVAEPGAQTTPTPTDAPPNGTDSPDEPLGGSFPPLFGGVALVVGAAALGAYALAARGDPESAPAGDVEADSGPGGAGAVVAESADGPDRERPTDDAGTGDGAPATADDDGIDEELLSDEERVERLLRRNDGRMRQANIVTETGWSNAKVSQLLSAMDDEGRIDKLRIGRENLISLPDVDTLDGDDG
jgi:hypothetical protein